MGISSAIGSVGVAEVPTGSVIPFAGTTAPGNWLMCYGQAISRTTYADLFNIIGTTYGSGDGSTTFNVPDLRGRVIAGQDDMGGSSANRLTNPASTTGGVDGDVLGGTGGSETHTLTVPQLATHAHTVKSDYTNTPILSHTAGTGGANEWGVAPVNGWTTGSTRTFTFSGANNGSGDAHNNVQPTIILNYIIRI